MLKILDVNRQNVAYLENAYSVSYEKEVNKIATASFKMPLNDSKNEKIKHLQYVEIIDDDNEYIGLFRIMPTQTVVSENEQSVTYQCNHVLTTLMDSVMFKYHEIHQIHRLEKCWNIF